MNNSLRWYSDEKLCGIIEHSHYELLNIGDKMIDNTDRQILEILQGNARTPNAEISRQVGVAPSCVLDRIRKLEEKGIIKGYKTIVDKKSLGLNLTVFVLIRSEEMAYQYVLSEELAQIPEVLEVHNIVGDDCYLLKAVARDTDDLAEILKERFKSLSYPIRSKTTIVLQTVKEETELQIS